MSCSARRLEGVQKRMQSIRGQRRWEIREDTKFLEAGEKGQAESAQPPEVVVQADPLSSSCLLFILIH